MVLIHFARVASIDTQNVYDAIFLKRFPTYRKTKSKKSEMGVYKT